MGLFGSKKTYVSSTLQNLAGDETKRPDYLKTTVVGNIIADQEDIADTIQRGYLKGPGMRLRTLFRWAEDNYSLIGMPTETLGSAPDIDSAIVEANIPADPDKTVSVQSSTSGLADYQVWAEQWMMVHYPELLTTDWVADINDITGDIDIIFEDTSSASFTPTDFVKDAYYIYSTYMLAGGAETGSLVTGSTIIGEFPATPVPPYDLIGSTSVTTDVTLDVVTTVHITYSDARPDEDSSNSTHTDTSYDTVTTEYHKSEYQGGVDDTSQLETWQYNIQDYYINPVTVITETDEDIGGGVNKHTKTTVVTDTITSKRSYRIDTREDIIHSWTGPFQFIYRVGSGNTDLDALILDDTPNEAEYFPFIPIRLDNKFLSDSYFPDQYNLSIKTFKKATDGKLTDIIDDIADSPNLGDMDYIYVAFGVSVNVIDNSCRKYLYDFFHRLMDNQGTTGATYLLYKAQEAAYQTAYTTWQAWQTAQSNPSDPLYGTTQPIVPVYPVLPTSKVRIKASSALPTDFDMEITWQSVTETTGTGLAKPDATVGEVWFNTTGIDTFDNSIYGGSRGPISVTPNSVDKIRLYWQIDLTHWKALDLIGFKHRNYIYDGKYVEISMKDGLDDPDESGFLVPLHYPTFKAMRLVDSTQMSTACIFLVYNSYLVKKTGLLGSLFFKILLIAVIIAIVVFAPQLAPGLVHAAAGLGAALGLTGVTALVVGAAINAIAAMIISSLVMKVSVDIFGARLGAIIGTILSIVANNGLSNLANGQGFTINFGNILSAQNLTLLTSATGNIVTSFIAAGINDTLKKTQDLMDQYKDESKKIAEAYATNIGYGNGVIDPLILVDSSQFVFESSDSFLGRTLMTGSDIAELSISLLTNYTDLTISTDLA